MSIVTWFIPDKYEQKELFRTYCEIDFWAKDVILLHLLHW